MGRASSPSLSEKKRILTEIEDVYRSLSGTETARSENVRRFYDRYEKAIATGMRERHFLESELEAAREFKREFESKKGALLSERAERARKKNGGVIDSILREQEKRLERYAQLAIHPKAFKEIECLYGGLREFEKKYLPLLSRAVKIFGKGHWVREFGELSQGFYPFLSSASGRLPRLFQTYRDRIEKLNDQDDIQKEGQTLLREAYVLLRKIRKFSIELRDLPEAASLTLTLGAGRTVTVQAACVAVVDEVNDFFHAFRLKGLD